MHEHRLVITVSIALVIAIVGLVALNLGDTDKNDSARPAADDTTAYNGIGAFASDLSGSGSRYRIDIELDAPRGTVADMRIVEDSISCATSNPWGLNIPAQQPGLPIYAQVSDEYACATHGAVLEWTIDVAPTEREPITVRFTQELGRAPRLECTDSLRFACRPHALDYLLLTVRR